MKNLQPTTTSVFVGEAMASPVKRPQLSLSDEVVQVGGFGVFETGPLQMTSWEGESPNALPLPSSTSGMIPTLKGLNLLHLYPISQVLGSKSAKNRQSQDSNGYTEGRIMNY